MWRGILPPQEVLSIRASLPSAGEIVKLAMKSSSRLAT